jgi:tRNA (guanine37-N1)-methyltransferase
VKKNPITFHIITLFPESFDSYTNVSILKRAQERGLLAIKFYNPRDFVADKTKYRAVDDKPYGGGPGMVMKAEPILKAVQKARGKKTGIPIYIFSPSGGEFSNIIAEKLTKVKDIILISGRYEGIDARVKKIVKAKELSIGNYTLTGGGPGMVMKAEPILKAVQKARGKKTGIPIYIFSPSGGEFSNIIAEKLTKVKDIILISGRYEGIDARVKKIVKAKELSIGNYTLTGGELPALVVLDAVARRIKGALGSDDSVEERRIAGKDVYTRPAEILYKGKKHKVPKVLQSGNHAQIDSFRVKKK